MTVYELIALDTFDKRVSLLAARKLVIRSHGIRILFICHLWLAVVGPAIVLQNGVRGLLAVKG